MATESAVGSASAGVVQGVGFRPFVYRLATRHGLGGFVLNDGDGVVIEAEGERRRARRVRRGAAREAPPLARVDRSTRSRSRRAASASSAIVASPPAGGGAR